ncbi:ShlB/FhaC/HecB family hemolysin secretion/activation protein [Pseudoalteromonas sp. T1lg48]|uniref:ShlB/FhaC/HecB family hemolysin secretion/activation protein n=1 Tax=Pseudoalteromonas sp. T1lg48 TaxID=2077100 RepID=UPI000CF5FEB3|nr:POTRA domain-containing protein [Pseudoalteromonas sp. T1lg48]
MERAELEQNQLLPTTERTQSTAAVWVQAYAVHGNTLLSKQLVEQVLAPYKDKNLSTTEIHQAANALQQAYRAQGLFAARVIIPAQAVSKGTIVLHVYEGLLANNGVHLVNSQERVDNERLISYLQNNITQGEHVLADDFERVITLIERIPGISSKATLYPGAEVGTANFLVETFDEPRLDGSVYVNNFGNYYTGEERLGANINVNSPTKSGDLLSLDVVSSGSKSNYLLVRYSRPLGGNGARFGLSADAVDYKLGKRFAVLDAKGHSSEFRVFASYPFIASRHENLNFLGDLVHLYSKDSDNSGLLSKRRLNALQLGISGDHDDEFFAAGVSYYSLSVTYGDLDIAANEDYIDFDNANAQTSGHFSKINFELARAQHLGGAFSAYLSLKGQRASENLDASQKFYIGGPYSSPGYPVGELSGDDATLVYADIRYDFNVLYGAQISAFYSYGEAKLYHNTWPNWQLNNPTLRNKIKLKSLGLGAHINLRDDFSVNLIAGKQVGSNLGADALTGFDTDESDSDYRFWAQAIYSF